MFTEWTPEEFQVEFDINLAEECETQMNSVYYGHLNDGRSLEIVDTSGIIKIDGTVVGKIVD